MIETTDATIEKNIVQSHFEQGISHWILPNCVELKNTLVNSVKPNEKPLTDTKCCSFDRILEVVSSTSKKPKLFDQNKKKNYRNEMKPDDD